MSATPDGEARPEYEETAGLLLEYVTRHSEMSGKIVETDKSYAFRCPNHVAHRRGDQNPSACISKGKPKVFRCNTCGESGNIYGLANNWFGVPRRGPLFVSQTLNRIRRDLGLPEVKNSAPLTDAQREQQQAARLLQLVAQCMKDPALCDTKYAAHIGLQPETCLDLGIGTYEWPKFEQALKARAGDQAKELMDKLEVSSAFFNSRFLTVLISDQYGQPAGFAVRDLKHNADFEHLGMPAWTEAEQADKFKGRKSPKWRNSNAGNPLYNKSAILYGLNRVRPNTPKVYVFEGYFDQAIAFQEGLLNGCALGGTALTQAHVDQLRDRGVKHVCLCLDNDKGGNEGVRQAIALVEHAPDLTISVMNCPITKHNHKEDGDPDTFILANGLEKFVALPSVSGFWWSAQAELKLGLSKDQVADKLMPKICATVNPVQQAIAVQDLADALCLPVSAIAELKGQHQATIDEALCGQLKELIKDGYRAFDAKLKLTGAQDALKALDAARAEAEQLVFRGSRFKLGVDESTDAISSWAAGEPKAQVWRTGIKNFDSVTELEGLQQLTGAKMKVYEALARTMIAGLCATNADEPMTVLWASLSRPRAVSLRLLASMMARCEPWQMRDASEEGPALRAKIQSVKDTLGEWAARQTLVIKDYCQLGTTVEQVVRWAEGFRREHPGRSPILVLDGVDGLDDKVGRAEANSLRRLGHQMPVISVGAWDEDRMLMVRMLHEQAAELGGPLGVSQWTYSEPHQSISPAKATP